ncbi:MAG: type II toxin-antitoxin system RelE/ParE family toxin [Lewinellaceae bacterium]|nr:type II toxin-antitoxin system RelE/ParE family toxin [Lewinellaceae bacterium]
MLIFGVSNIRRYYDKKLYGDKETEKYGVDHTPRSFQGDIQPVARRKLRMINNAQDINDPRIPPGNKLEKLKGKLKDFWSIRINSQWRVIFKWIGNDAYEVQIIDYH